MNDLSLVIDLSSALYLGLVNGENQCLAFRVKEQGARGETAHGLLDEILAEVKLSHQDIANICVGAGPGSFTGIRVAMALSQGLAFYKRLPLYPFSSLSGMMHSAIEIVDSNSPASFQHKIVTTIAANADRYFVGSKTGEDKAYQEILLTSDELQNLGNGSNILVTSGKFTATEKISPKFHKSIRMEEYVHFPRLRQLAMSRAPVLDGVIRPNYLMASAAEEKRSQQNLNITPLDFPQKSGAVG